MIEHPAAPGHLLDVLGQVGAERVGLDMTWDHHDRPDEAWRSLLRGQLARVEHAAADRRAELVRLAALAVACVQALDRRPPTEVGAPVVSLVAVAGA